VAVLDSNPFYTYYARWRVPPKIHGRLRFCIRSVDAAGNKSNLSNLSNLSCAWLVIRWEGEAR
jgi:hypothetical protein